MPEPKTPEEAIKLHREIERIFMPQYVKQLEEVGLGEGSDKESIRLVHYTSAEAALEIIKQKRLWMRNTTCMSDYREIHHGVDMLYAYFRDENRKKKFIDGFDSCFSGASIEATRLFDERLKDILLNTYITSLSLHQSSEDNTGRLSMWRGFGGSAHRVAIVFQIPRATFATIELGITFSPVAYLEQNEATEVLNTVVENVVKNKNRLIEFGRNAVVQLLYRTLIAAVVCSKHSGFSEEQEWRAIYLPTLDSSELMKPVSRTVAGIPQRIYELPLDANLSPKLQDIDLARLFERLIIGPTQFPWVIGDTLIAELSEIGVQNAGGKVFASDIPIRT